MKAFKQPSWAKLDNASLIYPSSLSRRYMSLYRMYTTLDKPVDGSTLQQALENTVRRFPSFGYSLQKGMNWWYFGKINHAPVIGEYSETLKAFDFRSNADYLFKISFRNRTICMDMFHALTDGNGGMRFLLTLTGEYLRLKEGIVIDYNQMVANPFETPEKEEFEDSFDRFSGEKGALEKDDAAYHIKGRIEKHDVLNNIKVVVPTDSLKAKAGEYGCTINDLITSVMILALQRVRDNDTRKHKRSSIKISVPVNLRPVFRSCTMRNFSSYVNLGVDVANGNYRLEDIIKEVSLQKELQIMPQRLIAKVAGNVALEDNLAVKVIPRVIKKQIISLVELVKGDKFVSNTLSNMGLITLPEQMQAFVKDVDFELGRPRSKSGSCACTSYGGHTNINMSRRIRENDFEMYFIEELEKLGIQTELDYENSSLSASQVCTAAPAQPKLNRSSKAWQYPLAGLTFCVFLPLLPFIGTYTLISCICNRGFRGIMPLIYY